VTACSARWGGTGIEVAAVADVLITMLPGTSELHDMMLAPGGVLAALPASATWIDMTSTSPGVGGCLLVRPAAGGSACSRHRPAEGPGSCGRDAPALSALADPERIAYRGGPGAGCTAKHLIILLWFGQALTTAEALFLAHREGSTRRRCSRRFQAALQPAASTVTISAPFSSAITSPRSDWIAAARNSPRSRSWRPGPGVAMAGQAGLYREAAPGRRAHH
jgi:hypothetical protein